MTGAPYFSAPEFYGNDLFVVADATAQIAGLGYQAYLLPSPSSSSPTANWLFAQTPRGAARGSLGLAAFADVIWLLIGRFPALVRGMAHGYGACLDSAAMALTKTLLIFPRSARSPHWLASFFLRTTAT